MTTMSRNRRGRSRRTLKSDGADYEVGYGRPPKEFQYKPGESGNAKGRPRGARNLKTVVKQVLEEQMPIREGGRLRRVPKIEALVRMTLSRAFSGDPKALNTLMVMMKQSGYGSEEIESAVASLQGVNREDIIANYLARMTLHEDSRAELAEQPTECSSPAETGDE
jgi:hypothetical protein